MTGAIVLIDLAGYVGLLLWALIWSPAACSVASGHGGADGLACCVVGVCLEDGPDPERKAHEGNECAAQHLTVTLDGAESRALQPNG